MAVVPGGNTAYIGLLGWTVGRYDWLDNPASKVNRYWRAIESGSGEGWPGRPIVGLWGMAAGPPGDLHGTGDSVFSGMSIQKLIPYGATMSGADLQHAKVAALYALFGGPRVTRNAGLLYGEKPWEKRAALWYLINRVPLDRTPFVQGIIGRPIQAQHYYAKAWAKLAPMQMEMAFLRDELKGLIGGLDPTTARGRRAARQYVAMDTRMGAVRTGRAHVDTRQFPVGVGVISITARAEVQDFIRDGKGHFSAGSFQDMVRSINRRMAKLMQDAVVAEMTHHRPSTGHLEAATRADENRYPL
jgi:hypothetical protein